MSRYVFTSESVTEVIHVCDQVSDAVLDALLAQDPAFGGCESVVNTGLCLITGEVTTTAKVDYIGLVRGVIEKIGYSGAPPVDLMPTAVPFWWPSISSRRTLPKG